MLLLLSSWLLLLARSCRVSLIASLFSRRLFQSPKPPQSRRFRSFLVVAKTKYEKGRKCAIFSLPQAVSSCSSLDGGAGAESQDSLAFVKCNSNSLPLSGGARGESAPCNNNDSCPPAMASRLQVGTRPVNVCSQAQYDECLLRLAPHQR